MDLAAEKDTGFDTAGFLESLASFHRFTSADFGVAEDEYERLRATVANWQNDLGRDQRREPPESGPGFERWPPDRDIQQRESTNLEIPCAATRRLASADSGKWAESRKEGAKHCMTTRSDECQNPMLPTGFQRGVK